MAYEPHPNEPPRTPRNAQRPESGPLEHEYQADPELTEGPASGSRIAIMAVAIALLLGLVFYGLNNASVGPTQPTSTATKTQQPDKNIAEQTKPPVAPGVRDVTPSNTAPGVTTGTAPASPQQQAPSDATQLPKAPEGSGTAK